jgi:PAS domain S-box-containing protein
MSFETLYRLLENAGLLALGAIVIFAVWVRFGNALESSLQRVALGLVLGGISVVIVKLPIQGPFGATFDTRAAPIVLAGFYLGPLGGFVAALAAAAARYSVGGPAAWGGVAGCFLYLGSGLIARRLWYRDMHGLGLGRLIALATCATIGVLPSFFVNQSAERGLAILSAFWPILLAGNILGILILGTILDRLMAFVDQSDKARDAARTSLLARQAASVGVWTTDFRTGKLSWDLVSQKLIGRGPEMSPYRPGRLRIDIHPSDEAGVVAAFEDAKSKSARFEQSFRIRRPNGEIRHVRAIADFVGPIPGDPDRAVGVVIDETSQQELLGKLALHSAAIEAASCGIVIASAEGDAHLQYVNPYFCEMTGYTREEIIGRNCRFLNEGEPQPDALAAIRQALAAHTECTVTLRNRRKDGVLYWVRLALSPVRNAAGIVTHFLGVQQEITEQVKAREALLAARDELRAIVQSAPSAILTVDESLRIRMVNDAAETLFGWPKSDLIGQSIEILMPNAALHGHRQLAEGYIADARARSGPMLSAARVVEARRRDGRNVPVQVSLARFSANGKPVVAVTAHDMSDVVENRQRAERAAALLAERLQAASAANESKTRFLANMSHELRTPLNAIIGYADMMLSLGMDRFKPARVVEYIGDIHRSGQHLLAIINDVLDLSRIEHDAFPVECVPQSARSVFASAAELVRPLAQAKALEITLAAPTDDLQILCDARATRQCLLNLLSNAVKFSPIHDRIDVEIRRDGTQAAFVVRDYGPGMASSALERVGEPFMRVENPKVSSHEGTGLGLSIVVKLAALQGGSFEICNAPLPGNGTRATLWLPLPEAVKTAQAVVEAV